MESEKGTKWRGRGRGEHERVPGGNLGREVVWISEDSKMRKCERGGRRNGVDEENSRKNIEKKGV